MFPDFRANSVIGRLTWSYPGLGRTVSLRRSEMKEASHPPSHPPPLSNLTLLHPLLMDISLLFKYWYLLRKQKSENFYPDNWPLTKWNKKIPAKVHRHLVEPKQNHLFLRPRCQITIFCSAIATGVRQCQLTLWSSAAADHLDNLQINLEISPNLYFLSAQKTNTRPQWEGNCPNKHCSKWEVRPIPRISVFSCPGQLNWWPCHSVSHL